MNNSFDDPTVHPDFQEAFKGQFEQLKKLFNDYYLSQLNNRADQYGQFCQEVIDHVTKFESGETPDHGNISVVKTELSNRVRKESSEPTALEYSKHYPTLSIEVEKLIGELPDKINVQQHPDRFTILKSDRLIVKIRKFGKKIGFFWSRVPRRFANLFRRTKKPIHFWLHEVPVQQLFIKHYESSLPIALRLITGIYYKGINQTLLEVKSWEEHVINDESSSDVEDAPTFAKKVLSQLDTLKESISNSFDNIINGQQGALLKEIELVGTLELSELKFAPATIRESLQASHKDWSRNNLNWQNTHYALLEEWISDLELFALSHAVHAEVDTFTKALTQRIQKAVIPTSKAIHTAVEKALKDFESQKESPEKILAKTNYSLAKKLDVELVPQLKNGILSLNFANQVDKLEVTLDKKSEALEDRIIVKTDSFDKPLKADELQVVSIYDLIEFEPLAKFKKTIKPAKTEAFNTLNETAEQFEELDNIASFSFNSAISALKNNDCSEEEAIQTAKEGLLRVINRLDMLEKQLEEIANKTVEQLNTASIELANEIEKLTDDENFRGLNLRIKKAKASAQARNLSSNVTGKATGFGRNVFSLGKSGFAATKARFNKWRSSFILTAPKAPMTREVSNFLLESDAHINKLPLVYKRLFQIEPLNDADFFIGRNNEVEQLSTAYENWQMGRYAATTVLGEQWSGLTSFINYSKARVKFNHSVVEIRPRQNINSQSGLLELLSVLIKSEEAATVESLTTELNEGAKKIIVLEDLQQLFLREIGGFEALKLLFHIINKTHQNIFWITSCNVYAWQYLQQTIHIEDYFSYQIKLKELTNDEIVNIILRRNSISGFNVIFKPSEAKMESKKFQKLNESEQQQLLKQEYFESLNVFAKSNVSMALTYWLLSTLKAEQNAITVNAFPKPDFGFLNTLNANKVYILQALTLHDGLTKEQLCNTLNFTMAQTELWIIALMEDGIIHEKKGIFQVNLIIYRAVVNLLKDKNLIH